MSVKCICVNAKNRPKEIPLKKWLKEGNEYTISYTCRCMPQNITGCYIDEIDLDGIGNDHTADLIMSKDAWEALNSGEKINITTTEDFKKKYVYKK